MIVPALAIAGALVAKKTVPASAGTFPTDGPLFVGLLVGTIVIVGGLTFFPALALGPVANIWSPPPGRPSEAKGAGLPASSRDDPRRPCLCIHEH